MFGWERAGAVRYKRPTRFGLLIEPCDNGLWVEVHTGRRTFYFAHRKQGRRITGPDANRSVLACFFRALSLQPRGGDFRSGFAAAAKKPIPTRAEQARQFNRR